MKLDELLNRIHGFTRDAILVTEAEPIDEPGPRIVFVNRAFEEETGYLADEVLGLTPRLLQGDETCALARARIRKALGRWQPIREELLNYRKDGTPFWVDMSIVPVADETGWFRYWVSVQRNVSARKRMEKELVDQRDAYRRASLFDELTGLLNRRGLKTSAAAARENNAAKAISLLAIDLDRFKTLNDTLGHGAGDAVLKAVATRLSALTAGTDLVARMGGDEFLMLSTASAGVTPPHRAAQIQAGLSQPVRHGGTEIACQASVGIATGSWEDYDTGMLFRRADLALYAAKTEGRGRAVLFAPEMERRFLDRSALASDLQDALRQGALSVAYMPKVRAEDRQTSGVEALARWSHPAHGDISPATFIALAGDLKIVEDIDAFVLRTVLQDRQRLQAAGTEVPPISVNVSARRLRDGDFIDDIERLDLTGRDISVELLETVILDQPDARTLATLSTLRSRGIEVEIDDFGTGHASIISLLRIKPDWLKLDRSFAQDILSDGRTRDIVRSALGMACALGIRVLAEGVETEAQAGMLTSLGCYALQGFLFGQPTSLEAALRPAATDRGDNGSTRRAG